jgi:heme/copper-type cytochrome/quinol oxidase subunit 1
LPLLTRWFIRSSLLFLLAALLLRVAQAVSAFWEISPLLGSLTPVYFHMFLVGWITQLIFGVVYWMFPKYSREKPRGNQRLAWTTFWLINSGLLLRVVGEPYHAVSPQSLASIYLLAASALLQWVAGISFFANTWPRVKER